jgi:xylulokinase
MRFVLALDIGTTSVKAGLFNSDGVCCGVALEEYRLLTPLPDRAELDTSTYLTASIKTISKVVSEAAVDVNEIVGLAVSSQGETLITLDSEGNPVRNAIVWMDYRSVEQSNYLKGILGQQVYDHTGIPEVVPTWPACKILWMKEKEPENYRRTEKFLLVQDYLIYCLTGKIVTDGSISCTTLYYDIIEQNWWQPVIEAIGINPQQLPTLLPVGAIAGTLTPWAAKTFGLHTDIKVICGGMDQSVGAIGAGNIDEGVISETTGAALAIQVTIRKPMIDQHRTTPVYVHSVPGRYLFVPVCPTAGMAYKWFKDNFVICEDSDPIETTDPYEQMNILAEKVQPGCDGLVMLPHLMGAFSPESNPCARGSFTGFTLLHGKGHFARAIQEAVAFMLRQNVEVIQQAGVIVNEVRTSGGASRSNLWNQIKSDVCGLPIKKLANADAAMVGNAVLAGVACNLFPTISDACKLMIHTTTQIVPSSNQEIYDGYYHRYLDLDHSLKGFYQRNYSI